MDKYENFKYGQRELLNKFSFWFPKVKDCGIRVPKSAVFQVPADLIQHFYCEHYNDDVKAVSKWVDETVLPELKKQEINGLLFVKNSVFSDKFNAGRTCFATPYNLAFNLLNLNYDAMSMIMGYAGEDELVVRERVFHNATKTPCIYGGLPLRPEFRVFYDFDTKEVLFTANYWDYEYVYPHLYDATDKIVFHHERERIRREFDDKRELVEEIVAYGMENVQGLSGPWSVDIMMDEQGEFWLIDMAVAEQSAFWEKRHGLQDKKSAPDCPHHVDGECELSTGEVGCTGSKYEMFECAYCKEGEEK